MDRSHPFPPLTPREKKGRLPACPECCPSGLAAVSGVKGGRRPSRSDCAATLEAGGASPHTARLLLRVSVSLGASALFCARQRSHREAAGGRSGRKEPPSHLCPPGGWPRIQPETQLTAVSNEVAQRWEPAPTLGGAACVAG